MKTITTATAQLIDQESMTLAMCVKLILTKYQPRILRISQANPCEIQTFWPHGYSDGDTVRIIGVRGMTALNRRDFTILKVNDYAFQINEDTSGYPEYSGKGEARKVVAFTNFIRDLTLNY